MAAPTQQAEFEVVDHWGTDATGRFEVGMRMTSPPVAPKPVLPKIVRPDVAVSGPDASRDHRIGPARVAWYSSSLMTIPVLVLIIGLAVWNHYTGTQLKAEYDERTNTLLLTRDAEATAAKAQAQSAATASQAETERLTEVAALREALDEANRRLMEQAVARAEPDDPESESALPASILTGEFTVYADTARKRVLLGRLATSIHRVQARELVAMKTLTGEVWTVLDPFAGGREPSTIVDPKPILYAPPAGSVVISESELKALRACRNLLIEWQRTGTGSVHWRLDDGERAARDNAISGGGR